MPNVPPRGLPARHNGQWKNPTNVHVRDAGVWKQAEFVWARHNGAWELLWARAGGSPASVTIAYATTPGTQVNVSWVPSTPAVADTYRVYRPDGSLAGSVAAPATTFTDPDPRPLNGAYAVKGVLGGDESAPPTNSNVLDLRLQPATLGSTVQGGGTSIDLAWTHNALGRPDEYDIYRNGVFLLTVGGAAVGWTDLAPIRGAVVDYDVVPVLTDLPGLLRDVAVNVPANVPANVVLTATTSPISNLRLTWDAPAGGVTAYEVETSPDGAVWTPSGDDTSPSDYATIGTGYMRVRTTSPGGTSSWVQRGPTAAINDVTPPANVTVTSWKPEASYGRMVVRFTTPATDTGSYKVQERVDGGAWTDVTGWVAATDSTPYAVVCSTRSAGQTADFKVLLRDAALTPNENTGITGTYVLVASPILVDPSGDVSGTNRGGTWRNDGTRSTTEIATGWTSSGHNIGCWFYGTAIAVAIAGRPVVSATIDYWRENEGGTFSAVQPLFWTHALTGRSATPSPNAHGVAEASRLGSGANRSASPTSGQFSLPAAFITALQDGSARGLCVYRGYVGSGDPDNYYMLIPPGGSVGGTPSRVNGRLAFNHLG